MAEMATLPDLASDPDSRHPQTWGCNSSILKWELTYNCSYLPLYMCNLQLCIYYVRSMPGDNIQLQLNPSSYITLSIYYYNIVCVTH